LVAAELETTADPVVLRELDAGSTVEAPSAVAVGACSVRSPVGSTDAAPDGRLK
jgi:hypothetical protein